MPKLSAAPQAPQSRTWLTTAFTKLMVDGGVDLNWHVRVSSRVWVLDCVATCKSGENEAWSVEEV